MRLYTVIDQDAMKDVMAGEVLTPEYFETGELAKLYGGYIDGYWDETAYETFLLGCTFDCEEGLCFAFTNIPHALKFMKRHSIMIGFEVDQSDMLVINREQYNYCLRNAKIKQGDKMLEVYQNTLPETMSEERVIEYSLGYYESIVEQKLTHVTNYYDCYALVKEIYPRQIKCVKVLDKAGELVDITENFKSPAQKRIHQITAKSSFGDNKVDKSSRER